MSLGESLKLNTTLTVLNLECEDKRKKDTRDIHQQFTLCISLLSIDNKIGDTGATSLSEALKSNTTLTKLNLCRDNKRKKTHKRHPSTIHSFPFIFTPTDNNVGDTGAASLSESLKSNTTLTELDLYCKGKRKKTHKRHPSTIHSFLFHHTNSQQYRRYRDDVIE